MSTDVPSTPAPNKLPVWETAKEAYARVFDSPRLLVRAALVPYCLSLAITALSITVQAGAALTGLIGFLSLLPLAIFGVAWHRLSLLGPVDGAPPLMSGWGRRQWRFLGYSVAVTLIGTGVFIAVFLLGITLITPSSGSVLGFTFLLMIVIATIFAYLAMRMSFVFPAVSVDENYSVRHAWIHTRGQGLRLIGATVIAAGPMLALSWGVSEILNALLFVEPVAAPGQDVLPPELQVQALIDTNRGAYIVSQAIGLVIGYIDTALMVSAVSIAFRTCAGWVPAASNALVGNDESQ